MITTGDKSGFKVTIQRPGGDAFNEHEVKQTPKGYGQPSITRCWLESEKDATFEIECEIGVDAMIRNNPYDWTVDVHVDGRRVQYTAQSRDSSKPSTIKVSRMLFMENGVKYEGVLKFADLKTTDREEEVTLSGGQLQSLGIIRIDFARGKKGKDLNYNTGGFLVEPDVGVASEKGKKLGGGIGYADKRRANDSNKPVEWKAHDVHTLPYHRIEFNLSGVIEEDTPPPRAATRSGAPPVGLLAGPSRKRKAEVIEEDTPPPRAATRSGAPPVGLLAGPSRKRKAEVIDIDDDDTDSDQPEVKPDNKDRVKVRMSWLELAAANDLLKQRRIIPPGELVDLTGDD